MHTPPSILSLSAAGLYLFVLLACIVACLVAMMRKQPAGQAVQWLLLAALFAVLIALRVSNFEEDLRDALRAALRSDAVYQERRDFQRPLAVATILAFTAISFWAVYRIKNGGTGRRHLATSFAGLAGLAMIGLIALRLVSLHQIDALLYGPIKLNWIADIGGSLFVAGAALYYVRLLTRRRG